MRTFQIEDIQRLKVEAGDVLLVTVPQGTGDTERVAIRNTFETFLPVRVLVKTADIQVEVITGGPTP